jgi:hypothetical protein
MSGRSLTLARTATALSRNPLGLLALCLVVGEAMAGAALLQAGGLGRPERLLLCGFAVVYPLVVVAAIYRLISRHHTKLYAPADFRDERGFLEVLQLTAPASAPAFAPARAIAGDDFALIAPVPAANSDARPEPGFYTRDGGETYYVARQGRVFLLRRGDGGAQREVGRIPADCRRVARHDCDRELRELADAVDALPSTLR